MRCSQVCTHTYVSNSNTPEALDALIREREDVINSDPNAKPLKELQLKGRSWWLDIHNSIKLFNNEIYDIIKVLVFDNSLLLQQIYNIAVLLVESNFK